MTDITVMKSKVHRVMITDTDLAFSDGITLDKDLMDLADMIEYERVQVVNVNNGERFETFLRCGASGSRTCSLNGPDARRGSKGDIIILITYARMCMEDAKKFKPKVFFND